MKARETVFVNKLTNGILDPNVEMLGPVKDGGRIVLNTAAGCWSPMITPELRGGHEVSWPVYVEGAMPGDAVAIHIESVNVTSKATASGNDTTFSPLNPSLMRAIRVCFSLSTVQTYEFSLTKS